MLCPENHGSPLSPPFPPTVHRPMLHGPHHNDTNYFTCSQSIRLITTHLTIFGHGVKTKGVSMYSSCQHVAKYRLSHKDVSLNLNMAGRMIGPISLDQWFSTYGPRAKNGPRGPRNWSAGSFLDLRKNHLFSKLRNRAV